MSLYGVGIGTINFFCPVECIKSGRNISTIKPFRLGANHNLPTEIEHYIRKIMGVDPPVFCVDFDFYERSLDASKDIKSLGLISLFACLKFNDKKLKKEFQNLCVTGDFISKNDNGKTIFETVTITDEEKKIKHVLNRIVDDSKIENKKQKYKEINTENPLHFVYVSNEKLSFKYEDKIVDSDITSLSLSEEHEKKSLYVDLTKDEYDTLRNKIHLIHILPNSSVRDIVNHFFYSGTLSKEELAKALPGGSEEAKLFDINEVSSLVGMRWFGKIAVGFTKRYSVEFRFYLDENSIVYIDFQLGEWKETHRSCEIKITRNDRNKKIVMINFFPEKKTYQVICTLDINDDFQRVHLLKGKLSTITKDIHINVISGIIKVFGTDDKSIDEENVNDNNTDNEKNKNKKQKKVNKIFLSLVGLTAHLAYTAKKYGYVHSDETRENTYMNLLFQTQDQKEDFCFFFDAITKDVVYRMHESTKHQFDSIVHIIARLPYPFFIGSLISFILSILILKNTSFVNLHQLSSIIHTKTYWVFIVLISTAVSYFYYQISKKSLLKFFKFIRFKPVNFYEKILRVISLFISIPYLLFFVLPIKIFLHFFSLPLLPNLHNYIKFPIAINIQRKIISTVISWGVACMPYVHFIRKRWFYNRMTKILNILSGNEKLNTVAVNLGAGFGWYFSYLQSERHQGEYKGVKKFIEADLKSVISIKKNFILSKKHKVFNVKTRSAKGLEFFPLNLKLEEDNNYKNNINELVKFNQDKGIKVLLNHLKTKGDISEKNPLVFMFEALFCYLNMTSIEDFFYNLKKLSDIPIILLGDFEIGLKKGKRRDKQADQSVLALKDETNDSENYTGKFSSRDIFIKLVKESGFDFLEDGSESKLNEFTITKQYIKELQDNGKNKNAKKLQKALNKDIKRQEKYGDEPAGYFCILANKPAMKILAKYFDKEQPE